MVNLRASCLFRKQFLTEQTLPEAAPGSLGRGCGRRAGLPETREIVLAQRNGASRVVDAHGLGELSLRMRADPGDEQKASQHDEGLDLLLIGRAQRAKAPVATHPGLQQLRDLGLVLEEGDGGGAVVE